MWYVEDDGGGVSLYTVLSMFMSRLQRLQLSSQYLLGSLWVRRDLLRTRLSSAEAGDVVLSIQVIGVSVVTLCSCVLLWKYCGTLLPVSSIGVSLFAFVLGAEGTWGITGMVFCIFCRWRRFLCDKRPLPSIFTVYCLNLPTSIITPDRSHFLERVFWHKTLSPLDNSERGFACSSYFCFISSLRCDMDRSRSLIIRAQWGLISYRFCGRGKVSLNSLPRANSAGDLFISRNSAPGHVISWDWRALFEFSA